MAHKSEIAEVSTHERKAVGDGGGVVGFAPVAHAAAGQKIVYERDPVELAQVINRLTKGAGMAFNTETGKASPVGPTPSGPRGYAGMRNANAKNTNVVIVGRDGPRDRKQHTAWRSNDEKNQSLALAAKVLENTPKELVLDASKVSNTQNTQMQQQNKQANKWQNVPGVVSAPGMNA